MEAIPVLFVKKEDCCGCGACLTICPRSAIIMREDECGFAYPVINENACIRCGQCKKVCAFQNKKETNSPIECYAAISRNEKHIQNSASGGIFAAIAEKVMEDGGIVYGAAFTEKWGVHHIAVDRLNDLIHLQGSKYVYSNTGRTFIEARSELQKHRKVLFSGTPCQIAGLQGFLGKEYDNLLTIDIVCHGVPSSKMLQDYLKVLGEKHSGVVEKFTFRDKTIGWGINGSAVVNGKKIKLWQSASSYLYYFTKGWLYRENCYQCKYACKHRPADITIGDYWGIEKQHPELLGKDKWDEKKGISLIAVNTKKGSKALNHYENILLSRTTFEKVSAGNAQLVQPCEKGKRDEIIERYQKGGWDSIEKQFEAQSGIRKHYSKLKSFLPVGVKRMLKGIL